jgi:nitrogen-specific signal transduction histidine kinase/DNA-binding response OmpR family regulator
VVTFLTIGWEWARKLSEKALTAARRDAENANRAKSEFLSNMSHEIRTPMNSIIGFSDLLTKEELNEQARSYLKSIKISSKSLLQLINDILDLSKIEAGKIIITNQPVSIHEIFHEIEQVFLMQVNEKDLHMETSVDSKINFYVLLDEIRLRQVLLNIVGNAVKFTHQGKITLSCQILSRSKNKIDLQISVKDTGIGIDKTQQDRIFESFHQQEGQDEKKYGGTGLGLAISMKLVKILGGDLKLKSEKGAGSNFIINLYDVRVSHQKVTPKPQKELTIPDYDFNGSKVLIVDDIDENIFLMESILTPHNLQVISAKNDTTALEKFRLHNPELILMDIKLANMSGIELAKKIKEVSPNPEIPIIAITASIRSDLHEQLRRYPFCDFKIKPFDPAQLLSLIARHLETRTNQPTAKKYSLKKGDISCLCGHFADEINRLQETMVISEIAQFAEDLQVFGHDQNRENIQKFGIELYFDCSNFMIDKITEKIKYLAEHL